MPLPSSPSSVEPELPERKLLRTSRRFKRWQVWGLLFLALLVVAAGWQWLTRQQSSMVVGRPLSYPQTHLHTVVYSSQAGVVYLGTHFGLFRSSDGGVTWPQSQGELNTNMVTGVAVSPTNPSLLAALTAPTSGIGRQAGIYLSANGGKDWHFSVPSNLPAVAYPYSVQSAPGSQGHFYAFFTSAGWFETQDLGGHWSGITSGDLVNILTPSLWLDPANPQHLLMGGDKGLFETHDDGQNWQKISEVAGSVASLVGTAGNSPTAFIATDQGLYRWQAGQAVKTLSGWFAPTLPVRLSVSRDGHALYALANGDLWFSNNLGESWTKRWHFSRDDMVSLAINPLDSSTVLAGFFSPGLVLISKDAGVSWQTLTV